MKQKCLFLSQDLATPVDDRAGRLLVLPDPGRDISIKIDSESRIVCLKKKNRFAVLVQTHHHSFLQWWEKLLTFITQVKVSILQYRNTSKSPEIQNVVE